jgi:hypothetical protein
MSDGLEPIEAAAFRRLITRLCDADEDELEAMTAIEKVDNAIERIERYDELENEVEELRSLVSIDDGKEQKVANIVEFADNQRDSHQGVVRLSPKEIKGATGVSRRYAYDLCDDLPDEFPFLVSQQAMEEGQYGRLEKETAGKGLGVDFEGAHGTPAPVNKFTTQSQADPAADGQEVSDA